MTLIISYFLTRQTSMPEGTFGQISDQNGEIICYTCELAWHDNEPQKSCIPIGTYNVIPHNSPSHPGTWEIVDVPERSAILIHNGNTENDSLGCILVGDSFGTIGGYPAVLNSNATLQKLRSIFPATGFTLTIR